VIALQFYDSISRRRKWGQFVTTSCWRHPLGACNTTAENTVCIL